jgi:conjugal transfer pilus assembly protein TraA
MSFKTVLTKFQSNKNAQQVAMMGVIGLAVIGHAMATGTTTTAHGGDFDNLLAIVSQWMEGSLGKAMAFIAFALGSGFAIAKQTAIPFVFGLVVAIAMVSAPGMIDSIFGALI